MVTQHAHLGFCRCRRKTSPVANMVAQGANEPILRHADVLFDTQEHNKQCNNA